jgi:hypothetical protein
LKIARNANKHDNISKTYSFEAEKELT